MIGVDAGLDALDEDEADGAAPKNAAADVEPDDEDDDAVGCEADDEAGNWPSWSCTRFLAWSIAAAQLDCARDLAADTDADAVVVDARSVLAARVRLRGTLESTERASVGGMIEVASSYGGDGRGTDPPTVVVSEEKGPMEWLWAVDKAKLRLVGCCQPKCGDREQLSLLSYRYPRKMRRSCARREEENARLARPRMCPSKNRRIKSAFHSAFRRAIQAFLRQRFSFGMSAYFDATLSLLYKIFSREMMLGTSGSDWRAGRRRLCEKSKGALGRLNCLHRAARHHPYHSNTAASDPPSAAHGISIQYEMRSSAVLDLAHTVSCALTYSNSRMPPV